MRDTSEAYRTGNENVYTMILICKCGEEAFEFSFLILIYMCCGSITQGKWYTVYENNLLAHNFMI